MSAPEGNQFAVGNKGGGRKGYEFEKQQLYKMRELTDTYLTLVERAMNGELTRSQRDDLNLISKSMNKVLDKLHANRQQTDITSGGKPLPILNGVSIHHGNQEDSQPQEENSGSSGGDISE